MTIYEHSIDTLQTLMKSRTLTSHDITLHFLERIASIDHGDDAFNSVIEVNPDALNEALKLDLERDQGHIRGPLHGIPVLLKDNIQTSGKLHTTAGAWALKDYYSHQDASLVTSLKKNGAIILGKTNLTELANFMTTNNRNGYSSVGGFTLNPYDIKRDPSGSSTGSAVATSLRLAPVAIGTETGGSIMSPSRTNGVVGLKPTIGLVSRRGIVPISSTLDTAGPMGTNVVDVATLLNAMITFDEADPVTLTKPKHLTIKTTPLPSHLEGYTIGINKDGYDDLSIDEKKAFDTLISTLKDLNATLVNPVNITQPKEIFNIMRYEFKSCMDHYLNLNNCPVKSLRELIDFNTGHEKEALKYGQHLLEETLYNTSGQQTETKYIAALKERFHLQKELYERFKDKQLDMMVFANYTSAGPESGFPTLTLPIGQDRNNMPMGTYFMALPFNEQLLIEIAYAIEQKLNLTIKPPILNK